MAADPDHFRDRKELDAWRAQPEHWKGLFYYNKKDPALLVPKKLGIGLTFNFANKWAYVAVACLLLMSGTMLFLMHYATSRHAK